MSDFASDKQLLQEGIQLYQAGDLAGAEEKARAVLDRDPSEPEALQLLGLVAFDAGYHDQGLQLLRGAITNQPDNPLFHINLGQRLMRSQQMEAALEHYETAVRLDPGQVIALNMCGIIYQESNRQAEALEMFRRALELNPHSTELKYNLAVALQKQQQIKESMHYISKVLQEMPAYYEAYNIRGLLRQEMGQFDKAQQDFETVLKVLPEHGEAHFNLGTLQILRGQLPQGWDEYEWRWARPGVITSFGHPRWQGQALKPGERLLVFADAGFGDTLQFMRYLLDDSLPAGQLVFRCQHELSELFRAQGWPFEVVSAREPLPANLTYEFPLLSFPALRRTSLAQMPAVGPPYLRPPADGPRLPAAAGAYDLRVGFVWAGSPQNSIDAKRSCELNWFRKLSASFPQVFWASLQKSPRAQELTSQPLPANLWNADPLLTSFKETAALITQLDLVIAVDTSIVHLAGAMDAPVWVLLPMIPDWRWLLDRKDSPWYPRTRLFRQKDRHDWKQVFREVRQALEQELRPRAS